MALPDQSSPLHLDNLSADVLNEIFSYLNPIDIIIFSFCSKDSLEVAKNVKKRNELKMEIHQSETGFIRIFYEAYEHSFTFTAQEGTDEKVERNATKIYNQKLGNQMGRFVIKKKKKVSTFWNDKFQGLSELVKHISKVFGSSLTAHVFTSSAYMNRGLHDWINKKFQGEVSRWAADTSQTNTSEADMILILDSCKKAEDISFGSNPSPDLKYKFVDFNLDEFRIESAKWINFEHLDDLSHQTVVLTMLDCSLTNEDLNRFLRQWVLRGEKLKSRFICVEYPGLNMIDVLEGIDNEKIDDSTNTAFNLRSKRRGVNSFKGGYEVRGKNGNDKIFVYLNTVFRPERLEICIASESE